MSQAHVESLPAIPVTSQAANAVRGLGSTVGLPATDRAALADLGLIAVDGQLSPAGRRLRDDLRTAAIVLLRSAEADGVEHRARLYVGARQLLYQGVHSGAAARLTSELLVLPADAVPLVLAGWGRLQPMLEAGEDRHGPIDRDAFRRRCATAAEPVPAAADPALAALWAAPWRSWGAQCDLREVWLDYVDVEGFGTYVVRGRGDDAIQLVARPSSLVWGDLQGVLQPLSRRPVAH